jgi:hypothetical protein
VNSASASYVNTPSPNHQPHVYPLSSSPIGSSSRSSYLPIEISIASNQVDMKKKKQKIKKKKNKKARNIPTIVGHIGSN